MPSSKIRYCLNTSTIHGEKIDIREQIKIAAKAGYQGIEIWLRDVERYTSSGGDLMELRKMLDGNGLRVESAIAFAGWVVDDEGARKKGLEAAAKDMDVVRRLGGRLIAAPPAGATDLPKLDLDRAAERYHALLEVGRKYECTPQLEVWGFSKNFARLCEVLYVASAARHADACILPDVYHLYKGGNDFVELEMLSCSKVHVLHMNDYPNIPIDKINDADRVYPMDGIAPLRYILKTMVANGFAGVLSLELFNRSYWEMDPNEVAKTGLEKMKAAVALIDS